MNEFDFLSYLISNKDKLIPLASLLALGLIIKLVISGLKEIYRGASTIVKLIMILIGIVILIIIVISLIAIYVFLLE